jgi:hypothetical protein
MDNPHDALMAISAARSRSPLPQQTFDPGEMLGDSCLDDCVNACTIFCASRPNPVRCLIRCTRNCALVCGG